jgi:tryptophan synthase alpha chain
MSRIAATFNHLRQEGKKALIPFLTAGDPAPAVTVPLMHALVQAGANIIEVGVPFSDPMADGPTIQRASERALKHHIGLKHVLDMVREFRQTDGQTPVVLMGYANPIEAMGQAQFASQAAAAGVDGVLTVDYPPEECADFVQLLRGQGLDAIFLLSPTTPAARVEQVVRQASGFIYYVSLKGVTGATHLDTGEVARQVNAIRARTDLPIGVGFGIRNAETAVRMAQVADAVIVGSRIVEEIEQAPADAVTERVRQLVQGFRQALDNQQ